VFASQDPNGTYSEDGTWGGYPKWVKATGDYVIKYWVGNGKWGLYDIGMGNLLRYTAPFSLSMDELTWTETVSGIAPGGTSVYGRC